MPTRSARARLLPRSRDLRPSRPRPAGRNRRGLRAQRGVDVPCAQPDRRQRGGDRGTGRLRGHFSSSSWSRSPQSLRCSCSVSPGRPLGSPPMTRAQARSGPPL